VVGRLVDYLGGWHKNDCARIVSFRLASGRARLEDVSLRFQTRIGQHGMSNLLRTMLIVIFPMRCFSTNINNNDVAV
jgi:hypothetical protein